MTTSGPEQLPREHFGIEKALNEQTWSDPGCNGGDYKTGEDVEDGFTCHAHL